MNTGNNMTNHTADIAIIGGGGAGMVAAAAASEKGVKKVIVLESRHSIGGNAPQAAGVFAVESKIHKQHGFKLTVDDYVKMALSYAHWKIDPRLVRALISYSGDTIDWLETKGVIISVNEAIMPPPSNTGNNPAPAPTFLPLKFGPGKTAGIAVMQKMQEYCDKQNVEIILGTRARHLGRTANGTDIEITAECEGSEIKITAKSVIIATGGLAGNREVFDKYLPHCKGAEIRLGGLPYQGDGMIMTEELGGDVSGELVPEFEGQAYDGSPFLFLPVTMHPNTVWVNQSGKRYAEERMQPFETANILLQQSDKGKISYTIFDSNIKHNIFSRELKSENDEQKSVLEKALDEKLVQLSEQSQNRFRISNSWDELAAWMGLNVDILKNTITEYNSFCEKGSDDDFGKNPARLVQIKEPPFYVIKCGLRLLVTHGPIKINEKTEVIDINGNAVPGLYCAGADVSGLDSSTYNMQLPGHSFGFSVISGRIAGENAASYVK